VALAQVNPTVGDIDGNAAIVAHRYADAVAAGADVVVFPELVLTGYPPEDLLLRREFLERAKSAAEKLVRETITAAATALIGAPTMTGETVFNSAIIASRGKIHAVYHKMCLPNYGVFDEKRYFAHGAKALLLDIDGTLAGVNICEDSWEPDGPHRPLCISGARLILNLSASPYHRGKAGERRKAMASVCCNGRAFFCYTNLVGGQDELVFDGGSFVLNDDGDVIASLPQFVEDMLIADLPLAANGKRRKTSRKGAAAACIVLRTLPDEKPAIPPPAVAPVLSDEDEVLKALVCGTRDYLHKNSFSKALVGVSGGIDSALTAAIAAEALGQKNLTGLVMPGPFSSRETQSDAETLCRNLGIEHHVIPINAAFDVLIRSIQPALGRRPAGITEENLQSRLRGLILMTFSNATGAMVLVTGNKSEAATGYCTLYGDTAGGFAVIKDVPKTLVWKIARRINEQAHRELIPETIIKRVPSAELRPDQKDSDSLPEYGVLDRILKAYIEDGASIAGMAAAGLPEIEVRRTLDLVDGSEYKRRLYPPGVKITPRAFGRDWRRPLTNKYRSSR